MKTFHLQQTPASGPLLPTTLDRVLGAPGFAGERAIRGSVRGQIVRLSLELAPDDAACAGFLVEFGGQGRRVRGWARGPSAELVAWAFHALAARTKSALAGEERGVAPDPRAYAARAAAYLSRYEGEVTAHRRAAAAERGGDEGAAFVEWLAREEQIALVEPAEELPSMPLDDASAVYEGLLESGAVDDVFVSESELRVLLDRFRARRALGPLRRADASAR